MITDIHIDNPHASRPKLIEWIKSVKLTDPTFTVIDVGGTAAGWTHEVADAIVDINAGGKTTYFKANINRYQDWDAVREYVAENGKFSFAICSHTLEDIANPMLTLEMLPQIAKEGFIAVPSKYREFSHIEGQHRGYIHHRWIFDVKDRQPYTFVGYPKLAFLEYYKELHTLAHSEDSVSELNFRWKDGINYRIVNDDYLGPDYASVKRYYLDLL